jgi:DoxX-like family
VKQHFIYSWLNYIIAIAWIANGLFCKVLNLVPRHQEIVARILGNEHARLLTVLIGIAEIGMAVWILSGIRTRFNTVIQIIIIALMNTLEFFLASDLLLWGRANAFFAFMFILLIYYNGFHYNKKLTQQTACLAS